MRISLTLDEVEKLIKDRLDAYTDGDVETITWVYGQESFVVAEMKEEV